MIITGAMAVLAIGYARGAHRLWQRTTSRRALGPRHVAVFSAGVATVLLTQLRAVEVAAHEHFWAHMAQHELMLVVAAPLLALGRSEIALPHALPARLRPLLAAGWLRTMRRMTHGRGYLVVMFFVHSLAIWAWHLPRPYDAAATDGVLHGFQHGSFFVTALLFWAAVVRMARSRAGAPVALLAAFGMVLHTGVLGALLTLAATPLYDTYVAQVDASVALADQQLGGLIMWVPGCMTYLAFGLFIAWSLVNEHDPGSSMGSTAEAGSGGEVAPRQPA